MATLLWQRDVTSDFDGVKNTYSSWDSCMTKTYCKWPAIVGVIIGSLIVLSLVWCLARCLCCGVECCCGCMACCNSCCPSPKGRKNKDGYQQAPPPQQASQPYPQYQSAPPPVYASGGLGYRGAATFDSPSKQAGMGPPKYNEDALPAMTSWDNATTKHAAAEDVEMEKLNYGQAQQQQSLLRGNADGNGYYGQQQYGQQAAFTGDVGAMQATPYHNYSQHQHLVTSPTSTARNSAYPPTYRSSPTSTVYEPAGQQQQWGGYAQSVAPSYHTGVVSPQGGRKPVQGSWREG
ncbi:hypothetical protein LTR08_004761 [Meristemomyces frigidus]|nr:hypothetical protein LTR08_004761 [Meristemomyces frigidus]